MSKCQTPNSLCSSLPPVPVRKLKQSLDNRFHQTHLQRRMLDRTISLTMPSQNCIFFVKFYAVVRAILYFWLIFQPLLNFDFAEGKTVYIYKKITSAKPCFSWGQKVTRKAETDVGRTYFFVSNITISWRHKSQLGCLSTPKLSHRHGILIPFQSFSLSSGKSDRFLSTIYSLDIPVAHLFTATAFHCTSLPGASNSPPRLKEELITDILPAPQWIRDESVLDFDFVAFVISKLEPLH